MPHITKKLLPDKNWNGEYNWVPRLLLSGPTHCVALKAHLTVIIKEAPFIYKLPSTHPALAI